MNIGYEERSGNWDIIVKYSGDAEALSGERIRTVPLLGGYAVVNLPEEEIPEFASRPQIEFAEIPKRLYFQVNQALDAACIRPVQEGYFPGAAQTGNTADRMPEQITGNISGGKQGLSGHGVLVGIVDSGVDWQHPDFAMKTAQAESCGYGIRAFWQSPEKIPRRDMQQEWNIQKQISTGH